MTKSEATTLAKTLLVSYTVDELSKKLDISKPTLYKRFAENNWKLGEIELLKKIN